jgi:hypothetical protein
VGTPKYTLGCSDASEERCNTALDEYLLRLQEIRRQSIVSGLDRLQLLLESLPINTQSNVEQIAALKAAKLLINGELALLSSTSTTVGATISSVKSSTYAFGFAGGALVGLLIALQLTLIDKRVRSLSQLSRNFEPQTLLGLITHEPASVQNVAAVIVARARSMSSTSVALVPVDEQTDVKGLILRIHAVASSMGVSITSLAAVSSLSASDLVSCESAIIVIASRGDSTTDDIVTTWSVLEKANKSMLGVLLTDPTA